jgi:hypothetical protein
MATTIRAHRPEGRADLLSTHQVQLVINDKDTGQGTLTSPPRLASQAKHHPEHTAEVHTTHKPPGKLH